jgi:NifB/MoaA-like Fe-S oxidoreductase
VSIHATDPAVRTKLLRNPRGATSLRWLELLLGAGVEVHGQVVVCPGVNDGAILDDTMLGLLDRFSQLATVGVVPLGVSAHSNEAEMRPHTTAEAVAVLDTIDAWQARFQAALGRRFVYASDEYYLLAHRPFPELDHYDHVLQHENGIGMARTFEAEVAAALAGVDIAITGTRPGFFAAVEGAPAEGYRAPRIPIRNGNGNGTAPASPTEPRTVAIITGELGAQVLAPLLPVLADRAGVEVRLVPVANRFFGGNIGVTGLLTGVDVAAELAGQPEGDRYLIPDVVLSRGKFLDGETLAILPRPVEVIPTDGAALVRAMRPAASAV